MKPANIIFLFSTLALLTPILTAPYLAHLGHESLSELNYRLYSTVCHQREDRSYFIYGHKLAVCARCFGVYGGMVLGALLYPLVWRRDGMPPGWAILAALTPLTLDGGTQLLGLRESTNLLRAATGLFFGVAIPYYLIPALEAVIREIKPFLYAASDSLR
jgi:uncharacterized membrane protein